MLLLLRLLISNMFPGLISLTSLWRYSGIFLRKENVKHFQRLLSSWIQLNLLSIDLVYFLSVCQHNM